MLCLLAIVNLSNTMDQIVKGSVCIQDVEKLMGKKSQFLNLCAAIGCNVDDMKESLEHRSSECTAFKRHKVALDSFCNALINHEIHVEGKFVKS